MANKFQTLKENTNGKKTTTVSVLSVLFEMLLLAKPELMGAETIDAMRLGINSGLFMSLIHKGWRNKEEIASWLTKKFISLKDSVVKIFKKDEDKSEGIETDSETEES